MSESPNEIHLRVSRRSLRIVLIEVAVVLLLTIAWALLQTVGSTSHKG